MIPVLAGNRGKQGNAGLVVLLLLYLLSVGPVFRMAYDYDQPSGWSAYRAYSRPALLLVGIFGDDGHVAYGSYLGRWLPPPDPEELQGFAS